MRARKLNVTIALLGLALSACSAGEEATNSPAPTATACPTSPPPAQAGAAPSGAPQVPVAKTVAPSDTTTSTVIDGSGPQIQCGRVQLTAHNDVLYDTPTSAGKSVPLKLDVQVPQTPGTKPLVVYLTGGGFMTAPKAANLNQRTYIAEQGYVVASIEYRTTTNGATYSDSVADVKSAIRFLRAHAGEYSIDPAKVAVWGQSAGGYLTAMTAATNGLPQFEGTGNPGQSSAVQAAVDEFGPSDFATVAADFDAATQATMNAPGNPLAQYVFGPGSKLSFKDDPQKAAAANPVTYVSSSTPPFALFHGTADQVVSPSQTLVLHNAIQAKGGKSVRYAVQGANHGDLTFISGDPNAGKAWSSEQLMGKIVTFLNENLS